MKRFSFDQIFVVLSVLATLVVNLLANALPINGFTTAELSNAIPILFVPAGYVFSIWGIIYIGLIAFAIYQVQPEGKNSSWLKPVYKWFYLASVANILWILLWHYKQVTLSVVAMLVLLSSLIMIYTKLDIGRINISNKTKLFVHIPFSIYLGWISVATIANISAALYVNNWNRFGIAEEWWTVIMIVIAVILAIAMLRLRKDFAYSLVIIWALVGIAVKLPSIQMISSTIFAGIIVIIVEALFTFFAKR